MLFFSYNTILFFLFDNFDLRHMIVYISHINNINNSNNDFYQTQQFLFFIQLQI